MADTPYPIAKEMGRELADLLAEVDKESLVFTIEEICENAENVVGEFEHGTADVEDCEGVTLKQYRAVLMDFIRCMAYA